jgi:hypothetical protein
VIVPPTGSVSAPVLSYSSVCAVPTALPSTYNCVVHSFGLTVFVKYSVAVCAAPSES